VILGWITGCIFKVCRNRVGIQRNKPSSIEGGWHCWYSWYWWCQGSQASEWSSSNQGSSLVFSAHMTLLF